MKLKKCEYCGTEFDAALSQCPLCGKAVQPGAAEPQPVMPAAYKPAGGRGGKFSKKKGGHFAADPKKEKEAKSAENPYKIPKWMMVTICVILGLAVLMGAAFALARRFLPYYKWRFRALRGLGTLSGLAEPLSEIVLGRADSRRIGDVCAAVADELRAQGLSPHDGDDLQRHAYAVNDRIRDGELRNENILAAV